jgi:hypothetical protein
LQQLPSFVTDAQKAKDRAGMALLQVMSMAPMPKPQQMRVAFFPAAS